MEKNKLSCSEKIFELFKRLLILTVTLILIEIICFFVIRMFFPNYDQYRGKRIASGFTIYYNNPGYCYGKGTIKNNTFEKDLRVDTNGFVFPGMLGIIKPANTIRIFLMGGSALFGLGQARPYEKIKAYRDGVYSYEASIAGQLKKTLDSLYPSKKFEVVNAACSGFTTKQSMLLYLQKVYSYSPDFIIEFDGLNDLATIAFGTNKEYSSAQFKSYSYLISMNHNLSKINTIKLLQLIQNKITEGKTSKPPDEIYNQKLNFDLSIYTKAKYETIKQQIIRNSCEYLRILNQYSSVLKADSVKLIFFLQPLLNRININKQLSKSEERFMKEVDPIALDKDEIDKLYSSCGYVTGINPYDLAHLILYYYFDDCFSDSLDNTLKRNGYTYIDANRELQVLGKDFEFFTDYCHMTTRANKFIAGVMAREILKQVRTQGDPDDLGDVSGK